MISKFQGWLLGAATIISILIGVFLKGKSVAKREQIMDDLEGYVETQERMNEVNVSDARTDTVKRLRNNGLRR